MWWLQDRPQNYTYVVVCSWYFLHGLSCYISLVFHSSKLLFTIVTFKGILSLSFKMGYVHGKGLGKKGEVCSNALLHHDSGFMSFFNCDHVSNRASEMLKVK